MGEIIAFLIPVFAILLILAFITKKKFFWKWAGISFILGFLVIAATIVGDKNSTVVIPRDGTGNIHIKSEGQDIVIPRSSFPGGR